MLERALKEAHISLTLYKIERGGHVMEVLPCELNTPFLTTHSTPIFKGKNP
ncbi:MAG: hypothetical protein H0U57_10560 [Tatlockia sp.]|nr:hypothetical protein [Tatlockia sp.]